MLINDREAAARLNSPMNLINRLAASKNNDKRNNAMSLFIPPSAKSEEKTSFNPFSHIQEVKETIKASEPEYASTLDKILENNESQIKLGLAHDSALNLLTNSIAVLAAKLDDVKADKLPGAITAASKVVESIRKERLENAKNDKDREVHYHFYTPAQKNINEYEVIDVTA